MAPSDTVIASAAAAGGTVSRRELFEQLGGAARVTEVSAPAGSGKTFLLRSWIRAAGLADKAAWVMIPRGGLDPPGFWLAVMDALRDTVIGSSLVRGLTGAPDLDGWSIVERLLDDLQSLEQPVWLVIDDLHELGAEDALRQLELLLMRAPEELRFLLATRHDLRLGLHRLRLEGRLTEIRAGDLRFTVEEAGVLFEAAGVELSDPAVELLEARTEGWAAGLRLAALSLAGHSDPERFAAEFSGSERTVAEYLLAEVLERQPEDVKRLLLRTSILDRVNGELAERLTGSPGGARLLHGWRRPTRLCPRSTRAARGFATTTCSPTCSRWSCGARPRTRFPRCIRPLPNGSTSTGITSRRYVMPKRPRTGISPLASSPITGLASCSAVRRRPRTSLWPDFQGSARRPRAAR